MAYSARKRAAYPTARAMAANAGKRAAWRTVLQQCGRARYVMCLDTPRLPLVREILGRLPLVRRVVVVEIDAPTARQTRRAAGQLDDRIEVVNEDAAAVFAAPPPAGSWPDWHVLFDGWGRNGKGSLKIPPSFCPGFFAFTASTRFRQRGMTARKFERGVEAYARARGQELTHCLGHRSSSGAGPVMVVFVVQRQPPRPRQYVCRPDGSRVGFP